MDADRFDTLARNLTGTRSRRSAVGAALASGLLGALGIGGAGNVRAAAQGNICEPDGNGGLCVVDFQAIVRQGPGAQRTLASGNAPGSLRGYMRFSRSTTGNFLGADLLLEDGSSLPVVGQISGYSFQARIDLGQGQALVAVGVGEEPVFRCLGRVDGTITGTEVGDLGEWHATAGVQNIPGAAGGVTQPEGSGNRPVSSASGSGIQLANGSTTPGGSGGNATNGGNGNRPVAETTGTGPGSNSSGSSNESSGRTGGNGGNGGSSPGSGGGNLPANGSSSNRPASETDDDRDTVEARQEVDDALILACPEFETRCGNNCVNLQTDASNCGKCGTACARSEDCRDGICAAGEIACQEGQTRCSNGCVTTSNDVLNCGTCGVVCAIDEACTNGRCRAIGDRDDDVDVDVDDNGEACEAGQTRCSGKCTDLQTDETNCGACETTCAAGDECEAGKCTPPAPVLCPEGHVRCDGICKEVLPNWGTEGTSCPGGGSIPTECPAGRELCNGACFPVGACQPTECQPGWGYCYGVCHNFQNDPGRCGNCTTHCPGGICLNGTCFICPEGHSPCNGACVNTQGDPNHCGSCNNYCGTQCIDGQCTPVGPSPRVSCSGGETQCGNDCFDLTKDSANCGACGNVCGANNECFPPGKCGLSAAYCKTLNKQACGLGCVPRSDPFNCGGCGQVCPGGYACDADLEICYIIGGSKGDGVKPKPRQTLAPADQQTLAPADEVTCANGLDICAGVCTDLSTDLANCGACGTTCGAGDTCQQGQCTTPSAASSSRTLAPDDAEPLAEPESESVPAESEPGTAPPSSSCPEGQVDCGGVCTDLSADPLNCGDCGVACGPDISCDFGVCGEPPAPIAPEDSNLPVPEEEPVEPVAPPGQTASEPDPGPVLDPAVEPEPPLVTEPEPLPSEPESEPAP